VHSVVLTRQQTVSLAYVHGGCSILSRHGSAKLIKKYKSGKENVRATVDKRVGEFRSLNTYKDMTYLKFGNLFVILRTSF
jgi:hypothetical protein